MIDFYSYRTANGRKVSILLEECGLDYELHIIDIIARDQDHPAFRAINPNGRIPAIVDRDGPEGAPLTLFESGAILIYLAEKAGCFIPKDCRGYWTAIQWTHWQMGAVGPSFGQAFHFLHQHQPDALENDLSYCRAHYLGEVKRLSGVIDRRLKLSEYLCGSDYTIADIATFPWIALHRWLNLELGHTPNLLRWYEAVRHRPAVRRGMDIPSRQQIADHGGRVW